MDLTPILQFLLNYHQYLQFHFGEDHDRTIRIYSRRLLETLNFQKGEIGPFPGIGKVLNLSDF